MPPDLLDLLPWFLAMGMLICGSAFFSASEAALFYLRWSERKALEAGNLRQRRAAQLLRDPDRLLTAVLFCNLTVNIAYFACVSIVGLKLDGGSGGSRGAAFGCGALLTIIFFSEMLPKSLAVLGAARLAEFVSLPLALTIRLVDPLMPLLRLVNLISRRLIWPGFQSEPNLQIADLERAIELSIDDAQLVEQEQSTLRNIVLLSDIRADEWMRPRTHFKTFAPPVTLDDLAGEMTPSGYLLVTEPDSEEVAGAIHLKQWYDVPTERLEFHSQPVIHLPWCATVADTLQKMRPGEREVAAVVNEYGETIGILTFADILDTLFHVEPTRSDRLLQQRAIQEISPGVWHVAGITSLRRLGRALQLELPPSKSVTVAGVIEESLERLAEPGDEVRWGPFDLHVLSVLEREHLLVRLTRVVDEEPRE